MRVETFSNPYWTTPSRFAMLDSYLIPSHGRRLWQFQSYTSVFDCSYARNARSFWLSTRWPWGFQTWGLFVHSSASDIHGNHNILSDALFELVFEVVDNINSAIPFYLYKKRPEPPLSWWIRTKPIKPSTSLAALQLLARDSYHHFSHYFLTTPLILSTWASGAGNAITVTPKTHAPSTSGA